ncbi:tyrosine-type recombinase/integrase [Dactylosporangium maewongense]|uniref:Tyrosine-type recombinase/integrase n=1 Tax=Dactylosporangium maewongense TaxID=634393 RepID=A0ABN1ZSR8_9ACTN
MAEGSIAKHCSCRDSDGRRLNGNCPKLRRPGGAWSPTHGRWAYQLELPPTAAGVRRQLRRRGFDTRDDALGERGQAQELLALAGTNATLATEIADLLSGLKAGRPLPDRDQIARRVRAGIPATQSTPMTEYLRQWLRHRKIEPTTRVAYEGHIRNHLTPHLGHIPIDELRVVHVQAMFDAITDRNTAVDLARQSDDPAARAGVKGIRITGPATMHRIRATLRKALNDAISTHRLIEFNPAAHVELPSGKRPKAKVWTKAAIAHWRATGERPSKVMVWMPEQAGQFLDHAEAHDIMLYALFVLIMHRGLRRGEAVGLRDRDVDLDTGTITFSEQVTTVGYRAVRKKVKTDAGDRTLALDTASTTALTEYQAMRDRWQLVSGDEWPATGDFFVKPDGTPWHPDHVSERFEELVEGAGLPPIRLHDLRHCAATYLKATGADLNDIKETLGHSSITITSDTYTSVIQELETERAKADAAAALVPRAARAIPAAGNVTPLRQRDKTGTRSKSPNRQVRSTSTEAAAG